MSKASKSFIRLNQDFYLDRSDIGKIISVIIDYDYYYTKKEYENCLLVDLFFKDNIRPSQMTILWNGIIVNVVINKLNDIQVKYLS